MTGHQRPPSGGASAQPWTADAASGGVTCPTCGLHNEPGARVCRNCGLPIAAAGDPLRGVAPGRVEMPSAQRAGLSATIGLAIVVALLLVSGTLAVSGGGILDRGGRIGVAPDGSPAASGGPGGAAPGSTSGPDDGDGAATPPPDGSEETERLGVSTSFTCEPIAIRDPHKSKWRIGRTIATAGEEGFDRVVFELVRNGSKKAKAATTVGLEWITPRQARETYGLSRLPGDRAAVITFEGPLQVTVNSTIPTDALDGEGMASMRQIEVFDAEDGNVKAVVGVRGEGCARLMASRWGKKKPKQTANLFFDVRP